MNLKLFIFLASDLFLDSTVSQLLDIILQELLNYNNEIDFKKSIPGLTSFYDLQVSNMDVFTIFNDYYTNY